MDRWQAILVFGTIAIVFDGVWATIARAKDYIYSKGSWVSFLIYRIAGSIASQDGNVVSGIIGGAGVAGIEATIGWWVSWVIGPGRLPDTISKDARLRAIIKAIIVVIFTGAIFGLIGALVKLMF